MAVSVDVDQKGKKAIRMFCHLILRVFPLFFVRSFTLCSLNISLLDEMIYKFTKS